jgi:hypothetical protein
MALFKTIAEVKLYWPTLSSSKIENIKPFIDQAERDFIITAIGKFQYDELNEWYNTETPAENAALTALLAKVQASLALYAYYLWIPSGQLQIGDSGIRIATTDTLKTAFQWQIDELQDSILRQAGTAMDALLEFLEENKDDYGVWATSDAYTKFKDCFIKTAAEFTTIYNALGGSRVNFAAIKGTMKKVQDFVLIPELSAAFYDELMEQYLADDLTPENAKVIPIIQKTLAHLTMAAAITQLSAKISENGILVFNTSASRIVSKQKEPAPPYMLTKMEQQAKADGLAYLSMLRKFLADNITDYPTYETGGSYSSDGVDTSFENKSTQNGWVFMG